MQQAFNPNSVAQSDAGIFGLPIDSEQSQIIIIPVPWEVTISYGSGASEGPVAIFEASKQVDLCHHDFPDLWRKGIYLEPIPEDLRSLGTKTKLMAAQLVKALENGMDQRDPALLSAYQKVNRACEKMNLWVKARAAYWRSQGKRVGLVGGDHSSPLGYLQLQAEEYADFGLLVIDAHMDLRNAYEGFMYSHASIFYNALQLPQIGKLVQVGIRDYCHEEKEFVQHQRDRVKIFFDRDMRKRLFEGETWSTLCTEIIQSLPEKVYVSVDIDGLDPKLCPNTGTPVPGGLQYEELIHLLNALKASDKTIIGFDLCEVSPGEDDWDGNVGARLLFHLCGLLSKPSISDNSNSNAGC